MTPDPVGKWLEEHQGVRVAPGTADDPARSAARLGAMARTEAQSALPFDTDPSGFQRVFEACAADE